jgi:uncharacterized membrane protein YhhN
MQPLNDDELNNLLGKWEAPPAPPSLDVTVALAVRRRTWARWLLTGSIRVPVPIFVALLVVILWMSGYRWHPNPPTPATVTLADFQPVQRIEPTIVRASYGQN